MSKFFGDAFGRTFELLKQSWTILLYPIAGALAGFIAITPVAAVVILLYFKPLVESMGNVSEDEAAVIIFQYLFSPGLAGALLLVALVLIGIAVQAYLTGALSGTFCDSLKGVNIGLGRYFKNGITYWPKAFLVLLVSSAIFGVPLILYAKFGIVKNLDVFIQNPDSIGASFLMGLIAFILVMFILTILYSLISYFWLPALIVGEREFVDGFAESSKLGFKNILYLITLVVIQVFASGIISIINNINPESPILIIIVMIINYTINMYFGFFKFVWYDGLVTPPVPEPTLGSSPELTGEIVTPVEMPDQPRI